MIYTFYYRSTHVDKPKFDAKKGSNTGIWWRHPMWARSLIDWEEVMGVIAIVGIKDFNTTLLTGWENFPWPR